MRPQRKASGPGEGNVRLLVGVPRGQHRGEPRDLQLAALLLARIPGGVRLAGRLRLRLLGLRGRGLSGLVAALALGGDDVARRLAAPRRRSFRFFAFTFGGDALRRIADAAARRVRLVAVIVVARCRDDLRRDKKVPMIAIVVAVARRISTRSRPLTLNSLSRLPAPSSAIGGVDVRRHTFSLRAPWPWSELSTR
jgi:hypothetical protein